MQTPRTDALPTHTQQIYYPGCEGAPHIQRWVPIEGAMELERELTELQQLNARLRRHLAAEKENNRAAEYMAHETGAQLKKVSAERDQLLDNQMTEETARKVLGKTHWCEVQRNGVPGLDLIGPYSALQLKALAWWLENKTESNLDEAHSPGA